LNSFVGLFGHRSPENAAFIAAAAIATALVVLAFIAAPRACAGGFESYFWCGAAALLLLSGLPLVTHRNRSTLVRVALAFGFLAFGVGAWLVGLFAANVRFICGLGYL
jgi:hypothetical protein